MVMAVIDIDEHVNVVLNILKAKYRLKNKSEAVELVVNEYEEKFLEPSMRPDYVAKVKNIEKRGKFTRYKVLESFKRKIEDA
jgi:DNA polymerase II large subunit